jgi:predicted nuclease of predicted toxin-antitoxin system
MEALKFVADEGVEKEIVLALRHSYDVIYIAEVSPSIPDEAILQKASEENRILITLDKDFGELVFRLKKIIQVLFFAGYNVFLFRKQQFY